MSRLFTSLRRWLDLSTGRSKGSPVRWKMSSLGRVIEELEYRVVPANFALTGSQLTLGVLDNGAFGRSSITASLNGVDFFFPGAPVYQFSVGVNGSSFVNNQSGGTGIPGFTTNTSSGSTLSGSFNGDVSGLAVNRSFAFDSTGAFVAFTIQLTNTSASAMSNVSYLDAADPDQGSPFGGGSATINDALVLSGAKYARSTQPSGTKAGYSAGFGSTDPLAVVGFYPSSYVPPANPLTFISTVVDPNSASGDIAEGIAFNFGTLNPSQSVSATYYMSYGTTAANADSVFTTGLAATVNQSPTALALTNTSLPENAAPNFAIGNFSTTDPNPGDTFTYTLDPGFGDNALFNISGNTLQANASFDFETANSYSIRVTTTDQGGLTFTQTFTINVTNVNEPVTNTVPGSQSIAEDTPIAFNGLKTISVADVDSNISSVMLTVLQGKLSVNLSGGATIGSGAIGSATLTLNGSQSQINAALATLVYTPTEDYNGSDTLTFFTSDAGTPVYTDTDTVGITISPVVDIVADTLALRGINPITANLIMGTNNASADNFENAGRVISAVTNGTKGSVTFLANGSITYTPYFEFTGSDSFTYTVTSGGVTETATVTVRAPSQSNFVTVGTTSGSQVKQYVSTTTSGPATATGLVITPTISGGSKVAYGDVNGDGVDDIIIATVAGSTSKVTVHNGLNGALINSFAPFVAGSVSAIYVAAGDANNDGYADVVVSNGSVGTGANSNVRLYDGAYLASGKAVVGAATGGTQIAGGRLRDFYGLSNATGSSAGNGTVVTANVGATLAMGDFNGDGQEDIVVGTANGGTSRVVIYDAKLLLGTNAATAWPKPNVDLSVYNSGWSTGVTVAAGDVNGDGRADLITGALSGGANIRVFTFATGSKALPTSAHATFTNVTGSITTTTISGTAPTLSADFLVGATNAGVRVAARDLNNDGYADILYTFASNQTGVAATYVGTVDGNGLRATYASTPFQLQAAPPTGTIFTLITAAYPGMSTGAFIA